MASRLFVVARPTTRAPEARPAVRPWNESSKTTVSSGAAPKCFMPLRKQSGSGFDLSKSSPVRTTSTRTASSGCSAVYVGMTAIIVGLSIFKVSWTYDYSNIFMIISAVSLFLVFAVRKPLYNNFINRIAQCSLFVYILQICSPFMGWLCKIDYYLLNNYTWTIYFILIVLLSLIFYLFCFVWDYARQIVTKKIFDSIESLINRLSQKCQSKVIRKKYI